jgi:lipopolysaccharide biosynthesis regulator YciM
LIRTALDTLRAHLPAGHPAIAAATHALGRMLEERGSFDEAVRVLSEAVRLRSAPGIDRADQAESLLELANSHFYAGHYDEAETMDLRLLQMHREIYGERHPLVAEDLINLGAIQFLWSRSL